MEEKNPQDILNEFKSGKIDISATIKKLVSLSQDSRDENLSLEISDILLEIYRAAEAAENKESKHIKTVMEEIIGKRFISKYKIVPREAMALGLIEIIMRVELENEDEIPNIHHVHAAFRLKGTHVIDLDIVEMGCPKVIFLELLPNLEILRLSQASLKEIKGLEKLIKLKILDLAVNDLTEIKGFENLKNLNKLYVYRNKIAEIEGLGSLTELKEFLLNDNPIKKLKGLNKLKKLKYIDLQDTLFTEKQIKKINKVIDR
jgi:Leucine-rich repeat (LRR) protein